MNEIRLSPDGAYRNFLHAFKAQVAQSRIAAARLVSRTLVGLYWELGRLIVERQSDLGWGKAVVERLAADLRAEYPEMTGFSPQNLWLIRQFFLEYQDLPNLQPAVGEIPWAHNVLIMQRIKDPSARAYYLDEFRHRLPSREDWRRLLDTTLETEKEEP